MTYRKHDAEGHEAQDRAAHQEAVEALEGHVGGLLALPPDVGGFLAPHADRGKLVAKLAPNSVYTSNQQT